MYMRRLHRLYADSMLMGVSSVPIADYDGSLWWDRFRGFNHITTDLNYVTDDERTDMKTLSISKRSSRVTETSSLFPHSPDILSTRSERGWQGVLS